MSNINQVIEEYYGNAWDCGDVLICLKEAHELCDPVKARAAAMRCYDVARRLERRQRKDPAHQPAPETVVCQDWHGAVREMRTGTPNSAMSADIAPTPSTPGWLDKAAETLVEKHVDSDEEIYQWGGGRWCVMDGKTWCWNARECEWNESTMLPEQLRQDGTRVQA